MFCSLFHWTQLVFNPVCSSWNNLYWYENSLLSRNWSHLFSYLFIFTVLGIVLWFNSSITTLKPFSYTLNFFFKCLTRFWFLNFVSSAASGLLRSLLASFIFPCIGCFLYGSFFFTLIYFLHQLVHYHISCSFWNIVYSIWVSQN